MELKCEARFFTGNRQRLYEKLAGDSVLAMTAYGQMQVSNDGAYPFTQEANFWYLTGIQEAEWRLIVDIDHKKEYLVAPKRARYQEIFDGSLLPAEATHISGIAEVLDHAAGRQLLATLHKDKKHTYTLTPQPRKHYGFYTNRAQYDLVRTLRGSAPIEDVRLPLARLRAIKQPVEIAAMERAIAITVAGIESLARQLPTLHYEYEAEAILNYEFRRRGASGHAFEPIVAGGKNACTLHYIENSQPLVEGTFMIVDVGARFANYPADITRSLCIGQPSERQQALFAAVERVHDGAIALCTPGKPVKEYQEEIETLLGTELVELGLIRKKNDRKGIYTWMPHAISHGLGIDVHDSLGRPEVFEAGMVLTVEPGIYIPDEAIGVRIEDDILVTETGPRVLSGNLPTKL